MKKIILASQSPRRKQLLSLFYDSFEIIPSHINEDIPYNGNSKQYASQLAESKASEIAKKNPGALIIGADTIVVLNNEILGKPNDEADAFRILSLLSGVTHQVFTGVSLQIHQKQTITFCSETKVTFRDLEKSEIINYVKTGSPMDKAGSYGIQDDWGATFVESIHGDYYTVVGFPLHQFYLHIKQYFPAYLPQPKSSF